VLSLKSDAKVTYLFTKCKLKIKIMHKAGYVNIFGNPNAGKSTLMNALVNEKLSIVTSKVQTTRHRILGIDNDENYQIVFSDTPGIISPKYGLQKSMMKFIDTAIDHADVFVYLVEPDENNYSNEVLEKINSSETPTILVINKIDLFDQKHIEERYEFWKEKFPKAYVLPVSALHKFNIDVLKKKIVEHLPEHPPYYDKDQLTDRSESFFVSEIIREKILLQFDKEIPYSVEVAIDAFKETDRLTSITANVHVLRESQKAIIIGHNGAAIKKLGIAARRDIEAFLGKHIYLELSVKVTKEWRDDDKQLKRFGYENE
jgi:GTP-binding protein Era